MREQVLDDLRQRERRILEAEPDQLRVLVQQRDDLARLGGESALARRQQVEVRQYEDAPLNGAAYGLAQLRDHGAEHAHRHGALLLLGTRTTVEVEALQLHRPQAAAQVLIQ